MGKITNEMLGKSHSHMKRKRDESLEHYLRRITHLYLAEKNISEIDSLSQCKNLSVLYLYDNAISRIKNLGSATNITHLYLQNNKIARIEGLGNLGRLSKLYLGGNCITVVEGLDKLEDLRELHVEKQHLPLGEKLLFEPRSLQALSKCLCVLNISGNNIDEVQELKCLKNMTQFYAENNSLTDMKDLSRALAHWPALWRLELTGNVLCEKKKYRDRVIVMSNSLVMLDGKEINEMAKRFLINWKASRDARRRQLKQQRHLYLEGAGSSNALSGAQLSSGISSVPTLPAIQGPSVHGVSQGQDISAGLQGLTLRSSQKNFVAIMQARAPHSTLLNKKPIEDVSQSRFPNIFAPARSMETRWESPENEALNGPALPLKT